MGSVAEDDRRWLLAAVELSRLSPPTSTNYAVGAVIVDHSGVVLATGYTGEVDPRDHAEEVALAKLARRSGLDLAKATLYSTLEPCTARRSRPATCTDRILAAGIKRVVIAFREPLLFADCCGVETLRDGGVEVVEITDMAYLIQEINSHVLELEAADGSR
jgi:diaminohydroxyphosphoribosylaminopyrimidine deaminase/5-amino-6-(5-phosphoribosylamino)uracil reductase